MKLIYKIVIFFFIFTNYSLAVNFEGKFEQGGFILGKTAPNSKVKIDNKNVKVTDDGYFAFGLGRDRKTDVVIEISKDEKIKTIQKNS